MKTTFNNHLTLTDWGRPHRLDGAEMQFMVTDERGNLGVCRAYFGMKNDAMVFIHAASSKRQDEEEPQGSDTATAAISDVSLTHIKNLETTIELLLEKCERLESEIKCRDRQISDLQDRLAKACCKGGEE
jgi:hypothetical protein